MACLIRVPSKYSEPIYMLYNADSLALMSVYISIRDILTLLCIGRDSDFRLKNTGDWLSSPLKKIICRKNINIYPTQVSIKLSVSVHIIKQGIVRNHWNVHTLYTFVFFRKYICCMKFKLHQVSTLATTLQSSFYLFFVL